MAGEQDAIKTKLEIDASGGIAEIKKAVQAVEEYERALGKAGKTGEDAGRKVNQPLEETKKKGGELGQLFDSLGKKTADWFAAFAGGFTALAVLEKIRDALSDILKYREEIARKGQASAQMSLENLGNLGLLGQASPDDIRSRLSSISKRTGYSSDEIFSAFEQTRRQNPQQPLNQAIFDVGAFAELAKSAAVPGSALGDVSGAASRIRMNTGGSVNATTAFAGANLMRGAGIGGDDFRSLLDYSVAAGGTPQDAMALSVLYQRAGIQSGQVVSMLNRMSVLQGSTKQLRGPNGATTSVPAGITGEDGKLLTPMQLFMRAIGNSDASIDDQIFAGDVADEQVKRNKLALVQLRDAAKTGGIPTYSTAISALQSAQGTVSATDSSTIARAAAYQRATDVSAQRASSATVKSGVRDESEQARLLRAQREYEDIIQDFPGLASIISPQAMARLDKTLNLASYVLDPLDIEGTRDFRKKAINSIKVEVTNQPRRVDTVPTNAGGPASGSGI